MVLGSAFWGAVVVLGCWLRETLRRCDLRCTETKTSFVAKGTIHSFNIKHRRKHSTTLKLSCPAQQLSLHLYRTITRPLTTD